MTMSFDAWREQYDSLSFADHQRINSEWAGLYPHQRSYDLGSVAEFLEQREHGSVIELGGWDGSLAALMLERFPTIETWVNYDITPNVPQACDDPRYERVVLEDWPWNRKARGDTLICSHVLEHMRASEIRRLLNAWDVTSVYVDAPVNGGRWDGYQGSHILELLDHQLVALIKDAGFDATMVTGSLVGWFDTEPS